MRSIMIVKEDAKWYVNINVEFHRENGPAIEYNNGDKMWYLNGKLHREDGPAIEYASGIKKWLINDQLHREDGPAVVFKDGTGLWYLKGVRFTEAAFNQLMKKS